MKITLVRHGQTENNFLGIMQGSIPVKNNCFIHRLKSAQGH